MTAENKNCELNSWFPMSYKERAEAFAHSLQSKLRSLGSQDENDSSNETWLSKNDNTTTPISNKLAQSSYLNNGPLNCPVEENKCLLNNKNNHNKCSLECNDNINNQPEVLDIITNRCNLVETADDESPINFIACQDINENVINNVNLANEFEFNEELEEIVEIAIADREILVSDITEEILSNALNIIENGEEECYCSTFSIDNSLTIDYATAKETQCENHLERLNNSNSNSENENDIEDDDNDDVIPRVRRCSSLKTGKTPPGTPSMKKIVRFADVLGLDLADVRTFLDEIPKIPNSAYKDLNDADLNASDIFNNIDPNNQRTLLTLFQQPGGKEDFLDKVSLNKVMLENAAMEDSIAFSIRGLIRVRNLDFNKTVYVRYSIDSWKSYTDQQAIYVENSSDGFSDKFTFLIYAHTLSIGQKLELAIRFHCKGNQYWDNNGDANYCFQCLPAANITAYSPITAGLDDKFATFYYENISNLENPNTDEDNNQAELTRTTVEEYIKNSLQKNKKHEITQRGKPEIVTIFIVLFFAIIFFYFKRVIM